MGVGEDIGDARRIVFVHLTTECLDVEFAGHDIADFAVLP